MKDQIYSMFQDFKRTYPKSLDILKSFLLTIIILVVMILRGYILYEALIISVVFGSIFVWIFSASWSSE